MDGVAQMQRASGSCCPEVAGSSPAPVQTHYAVHYVGFRGDEYPRAYRIWGGPAIIHRVWDRRARRDIASGDTIIFANDQREDLIARFNGDDIRE
jgi:hypothetical protein